MVNVGCDRLRLVVLSDSLFEGVVLGHLRLDRILVQRHELVGEELVHILTELGAFLKASCIVGFGDIDEVDLLVVDG